MKKNSVLLYMILVVALVISGCSSDEAGESFAPTATPEPTAVANLPEEAEERAPDEIDAPDVSASRGVFDTEAVVSDFGNYVLRPEDMPNEYRVEADGEQHLTNLKVINETGELEGKQYFAASGRLDGWSLELTRVKKAELIPYMVYSQIEVFESAEGAQVAFGPDWFPAYNTEDGRELPTFIEDGCDQGDGCVMYVYEKFDPTTELTNLQYEVAFVYKNVLARVVGRGLDIDMDPSYMTELAGILFDKIDAAPLVE